MDRRTTVKLSVSGALGLYAFASCFLFGGRSALLIAVGMLLGFHGDICLARVPFVRKRYKDTFLAGVASFAVGHLCYIFAFHRAMDGMEYGIALPVAFAAYGLLTVVIWAVSMRGAKDIPAMTRYGALAYALIIGLMASFAAALWNAFGGLFWIPALGGLLFVISDAIIAFGDFGGMKIPHKDNMIWFTYAPAQLSIVLLPLLLYWK